MNDEFQINNTDMQERARLNKLSIYTISPHPSHPLRGSIIARSGNLERDDVLQVRGRVWNADFEIGLYSGGSGAVRFHSHGYVYGFCSV